MAAEDKQALLNSLSRRLYDKLTGKDVDTVTEELLSLLSSFEITQREPMETDSDDMVKLFLDAKRAEGRAETTIDHYQYEIGRLLLALNASVSEVTVYHIRSYFAKEKERGLKDATLKSKRSVYSTFFNWLFQESLINKNPCANFAALREKKEQKKAFSETDIEKLKRACRDVRELSLISFMLSTGCRVSEIARLNKDDINLSTMAVYVLGKGNKERTVYMDFVTVMYVKDYLASRVDDNPALFVASKGKHQRLTKGGLEAFCRRIGSGLDIGRVYPHRFRRTFATVLAKRGMPIQEISILMGHENISTTMKYICVDEISMQNNLRRYA